MKKSLLSLLLSAFALCVFAQPDCYVVGPAYNMGSNTFTNYSFTRTASTNAEGAPVNTFTNLNSATCKAASAGIVADICTENFRLAGDLMFPFKNSQSNIFNVNLAGGVFVNKFGVFVGVSAYGNKKTYPIPVYNGTVLANNEVHDKSGDFYANAAPATNLGGNILLLCAPVEKLVFRVDFGLYSNTTKSKKTPYLDNYKWKGRGATKIEFGAIWQISDNFGLFVKYYIWNSKGRLIAKDVEYTKTGSTDKGTIDVDLIPEHKFKSKNLTFGLMIPLGSAESRSGTISVVK